MVLLLGAFANRDDVVVWIRTPDYRRQLYLSPGFEKIWGRKTDVLYTHPHKWGEYVVEDERSQKMLESCRRNPYTANELYNTMYFRIKHTSGEIRYIKDTVFMIHNNDGEVIAIAGIAYQLDKFIWEEAVAILEDDSSEFPPDESTLIASVLAHLDGEVIPEFFPKMQTG